MKNISLIALFLLLFLFETSFLRFLPWPFSILPLTTSFGFFLLTAKGDIRGFFWLMAVGAGLDLLHFSGFFPSTLLYGVSALVPRSLSHRLFSHRSLRGVLVNSFLGFLVLRTLDFGSSLLFSPEPSAGMVKTVLVQFNTESVFFAVCILLLFFLQPPKSL